MLARGAQPGDDRGVDVTVANGISSQVTTVEATEPTTPLLPGTSRRSAMIVGVTGRITPGSPGRHSQGIGEEATDQTIPLEARCRKTASFT